MAPHLMKLKITVPIYGAILWLIIADDIYIERKKMEDIFGTAPTIGFDGLCSYSDFCHHFGLFFKKDKLDINTIAHEVFHLTHRILDWAQCPIDIDHQEHGALLNGYLMEIVMGHVYKFTA
jgi:hypothetical protein